MVDKGRPTVQRSKEVEAAKIHWDVLRLFLFPVPNEHCRKSPTHRSPSPLSPRFSFANSSRGSCRRYSLNSRSHKDREPPHRLDYFAFVQKERKKEPSSKFPLVLSRSVEQLTRINNDILKNLPYFLAVKRNDFLIANIFRTWKSASSVAA